MKRLGGGESRSKSSLWGWVPGGPALWLILFLSVAVPPGLVGQDTAQTGTYARRGLVIGGISGGLAGGLALGVLANGLCESDCDHAFTEGLVIGGLAGGVFGGLTGLVIGAAIPRKGSAREDETFQPWTMGVGIGPRHAGPSIFEGTDLWVGVTVLRPTTSRVRWGLEAAYLGGGTQTATFVTPGREGQATTFTNKWRRSVWNLSLVAQRTFRGASHTGGYLVATAGAYPFVESVNSIRTQTVPDPAIPIEISERSYSASPGLGVGGGGTWPVGGRVLMGGEARLHLILGAGDDSVLPLFSVGLTLGLSGG